MSDPVRDPASDPVRDPVGDPTAGPPGAGSRAGSLVARLGEVTAELAAAEARPEQVAMCRAVGDALATGRHLVVQAGTGTGKSLAYLVPAVVSGRRVVVATATKALQDQLADKDLPLVTGAIAPEVSFAVLKGRSNYLCRQRALEVAAPAGPGAATSPSAPVQPSLDADPASLDADPLSLDADPATGGSDPPAAGAGPATLEAGPAGLTAQVARLLAWSEETLSGDRAELPFEPHPRAWAMVSVGPRECPGASRCPSGGSCFAEAARAAAAAADVVVVNTHLYGAHLASGGVVLPPHDVVVFDEAHELEEVMTASLGTECSPGRLRALVALCRAVVPGTQAAVLDDLSVLSDRLQRELESRVGSRVLRAPGPRPVTGDPLRAGPEGAPAGRERVRAPASSRPLDGTAAGGDRESADQRLAAVLDQCGTRVQQVLSLLRAGDQGSMLPGTRVDDSRRVRALSAAGHLAEELFRVAGRTTDLVCWVDGTPAAPVLRLSPIDVGPVLADTLWDEVTAVLTSATVPPRMTERVGLADSEVTELDVGSPFDHRSHSLLYVARHLPDRRHPGSEAALHAELGALVTAAGGRTLALFTSRRATSEAVSALRGRFPFPLLEQGEMPKGRLLRAFAEDEATCLFATLGFWQGVDVPGRSLSLVTLDRLPFARPDDPLLQARRERAGDAAFELIDLPRAATLLAQGAGRLLRAADDHGVVAVLDPRLATAGYRRVLLAALPPMRRTTDRRQVADFLARVLPAASGALAVR